MKLATKQGERQICLTKGNVFTTLANKRMSSKNVFRMSSKNVFNEGVITNGEQVDILAGRDRARA